jgi:hypothetical protein
MGACGDLIDEAASSLAAFFSGEVIHTLENFQFSTN